jgi:hypothetical protein
MNFSQEQVNRFQLRLQGIVDSRVVVSKHFIERLFERSRDIEEFAAAIKNARDILNDKMCVIIYQSVVNNGVTRVDLTRHLKMVCHMNLDSMKLIIKTVY